MTTEKYWGQIPCNITREKKENQEPVIDILTQMKAGHKDIPAKQIKTVTYNIIQWNYTRFWGGGGERKSELDNTKMR